MPEIEIEMVDADEVAEEIKKQAVAGGGKWTVLCKEVLETGQAAKVSGLTGGQVAAASKKAKAVDGVECRTFYKKGKVILYPTPQ